jgi:hypothetical protein
MPARVGISVSLLWVPRTGWRARVRIQRERSTPHAIVSLESVKSNMPAPDLVTQD